MIRLLKFILPKRIRFFLKKYYYKLRPRIDKEINKIEFIRYIKYSKLFNKEWYLDNYPEVIDDNLSPYEHYYLIGWKQGKNPSVAFDTNKYLAENPDVNMCPLFHYEKYGKHEGRRNIYIDPQYDHNYKTKTVRRFIIRKISNLINFYRIRKNKDARILVYIHIFYIYSLKEIIEYLKNLERYDYDLIITCNKGKYEKDITDAIKKFKGDSIIIPCENRGYDIGPFMEVLKGINLDNYDIFIKLQSKGTFNRTNYIYGQIFKNRDWFEYMFESLLGAFYIHKNIELLTSNNNIGIIAANNLIIKDPIHKRNFTKLQLSRHNLKIKDDYSFVAGTCYMERASLLKNIQSLKLDINNFEKTEKGYFSFAHSLERYITGTLDNNYIIYGNNVCKFKKLLWKKRNEELKNLVGVRLLDDKRFELCDDFVLRYIEHAIIIKYEIKTIKVSEIKKIVNKRTYSLESCVPYKFLKDGNEKKYINYCLLHRRTDYMSLSEDEFKKYIKDNCISNYRSLMKKLDDNNYDKKNLITIDQNNSILDGQHRACYFLYKYGKDYKVKVLKTYEEPIDLNKITPFSKIK